MLSTTRIFSSQNFEKELTRLNLQEIKVNTKLIKDKKLGEIYAIDTGVSSKPFIPKIKEANSIKLLPTDVVVDIGAHIGVYALTAARAGVKAVVAYEPSDDNFEVLKLNTFDLPNFEVYKMAVTGDDPGFVDFYLSKGPGLRNSLIPIRGRTPVTVTAIPYAEAVADATVVKIDVEGAEYTYPLSQPGLRALIIDFHPKKGEDWIQEVKDKLSVLEHEGFRIIDYPKFKKGWNASWEACATLERTL